MSVDSSLTEINEEEDDSNSGNSRFSGMDLLLAAHAVDSNVLLKYCKRIEESRTAES
jgi:hypothetical protein